jgi:hypothetical protein
MKNFRDYLSESEEAATNPVAGDTFAINIREECLIESVVVESRNDGVVIAADDRMIQLLESYGYTFEQTCMECGMPECGCGDPAAYSDDESQDPGEYDDEGDMAKDELMTMIRSARKLIGMLDNDDNMPEWTQKKITKATDYVDTAADYVASKKERGVMEQGVAVPDISGLGPDAQSLILKLRRDVEEKRLHPTPQAVLAAARELAGDMEFAPLLLVQQVLGKGKGIAEGSSEPSPVARAVLHRIMMQHTGMLAAHGPERVMAAVDEVADRVNIGPDDEIGSSDVSGYVREVERVLNNPDLSEQGGFNDDGSYNTSDDEATDFDEYDFDDTELGEAEYQGRKVQLGKPMQGDVAKSKVYVKDPKTGNVKKVNFGDPNMSIKKSNPARRKSFRARHNCDNPGPRTKARYWSCRAW